MKKLLNLVLLIGCFTLSVATTVTAQDAVRNATNCTFIVKVAYGPVGTCTSAGTITATVPPFTQINLGVPAGNEIFAAKGAYLVGGSTLCPFYIGLAACGGSQTDAVACTAGCGNYTADLLPGLGIHLH